MPCRYTLYHISMALSPCKHQRWWMEFHQPVAWNFLLPVKIAFMHFKLLHLSVLLNCGLSVSRAITVLRESGCSLEKVSFSGIACSSSDVTDYLFFQETLKKQSCHLWRFLRDKTCTEFCVLSELLEQKHWFCLHHTDLSHMVKIHCLELLWCWALLKLSEVSRLYELIDPALL